MKILLKCLTKVKHFVIMCKAICFTPKTKGIDMSIDVNMSLLLDFYGETLSEKQKEAMELFYNGDLSLSEIAEITGITRQGVRDRIVKSEQILTDLENKLGLASRFGNVSKTVDYILIRLNEMKADGASVDDIIDAAKQLDI